MRTFLKLKNGYTIIEMAIVILVIGVVTAAGADVYKIYKVRQSYVTTETNVATITQALGGFLARYGRYPCPADISLPRTSPNYGMETQCDPTVIAGPTPYAAPALGTCTAGGGICIQSSANPPPFVAGLWPNFFPAGFPIGSPPGTLLIRRGGLPFRVMNIPEDVTFDSYGDRLQYAVTEPLAVTLTYIKQAGGINVVSKASALPIPPATGVHFVVFSSGPDRAGAFSRDGQPVMPCAATGFDAVNCTITPTAVFNTAPLDTIAGDASHYDDTMKFYTSMALPMWKATDSTAVNIHDAVDGDPNHPLATAGCIDPVGKCRASAGGATPLPTTALDVNGTVQASAMLKVAKLCDNGTTGFDSNCLKDPANAAAASSTLITGDNPAMMCPPAHDPTAIYVSGITNNQVQCTSIDVHGCNTPGAYLMGINPDGSLNCQTTVTQCPAGAVLPADLDGSAPMSETSCCGSSEQVFYDPNTVFPLGNTGDTVNVSMSAMIIKTGAVVATSNKAKTQMQAWLTGSPSPPASPGGPMSTTPGPQYTMVDNFQCMSSGYWHYTGSSNGYCGCPLVSKPAYSQTCSQLGVSFYNFPGNFTGFGPQNMTRITNYYTTGPGGQDCGPVFDNYVNNTFNFPGPPPQSFNFTDWNAQNAAWPTMIGICDQCGPTAPWITDGPDCSPQNVVGGFNTGGNTNQQLWSCSLTTEGNHGGWGPPTALPTTCSCDPTPQFDHPGCPAGFTGSIKVETDTVCGPPDALGNSKITALPAPYVVSNTCTASCQPDKVHQFSCSDSTVQTYWPAVYSTTDTSGSVIMTKAYDCKNQTYATAWTPGSSTCSCIPPRHKTSSSPAHPGSGGKLRPSSALIAVQPASMAHGPTLRPERHVRLQRQVHGTRPAARLTPATPTPVIRHRATS